MRRIQRWAASAAVVAVGVAGLAGCQPPGAFFLEVREEGVQVNGRWDPITGDFDGDGLDDVLWTAVDRPDQLWRGQGGGTFAKTQAAQDIGAEYDVVVGDFGGNGADDILFYAGAYPAYEEQSTLWIMGAPGGGRTEAITVELPLYADRRVPVLLPDDGSRDGVVLSLRQDDVVVWDADDVHGGVTVATPYDGWGDGVEPHAGDFDGDGNGDFYVTRFSGADWIAWGDGAGGFTTTPARELTSTYQDIVAADLDGDGRDDLAFVGDDAQLRPKPVNVWFGRSDRGFDRKTLPAFPHRGTVEVHGDTVADDSDVLVRYDHGKATGMGVGPDRTAHVYPTNTAAIGPWNGSLRLVGEFGGGGWGREDALVYSLSGGAERLLLTGDEED